MPRRPAVPEPQPAAVTIDQLQRGIDRISRRIAELEAFDPQSVQKRWPPEVEALQNAIDKALAAAFGYNSVEYKRYEGAARLDNGPVTMAVNLYGGDTSYQDAQHARRYLEEGKQASLVLLRGAVRSLEEEIADRKRHAMSASRPQPAPQRDLSKVFVVHGHDEAAKHAVARFLEKLGLDAIILGEQPDQGRTIIEKFETHAAEVGFAVVLLTPDDVGHVKTATAEQERARQNVIFELGYFTGKLGRGRACLLRKGDVEIPSDLAGVIYTELDANNGWHNKLVMELKAAKMQFDANRLWE